MAGGVKKPVNVFKLKDLGEPEGVFNWRLWFAVISFGLLGAARGVDEGLISGAFNSSDFKEAIDYNSYNDVDKANIKANVSAMVQIGSVAGALMYDDKSSKFLKNSLLTCLSVLSWYATELVVSGPLDFSAPSGPLVSLSSWLEVLTEVLEPSTLDVSSPV